MSHKVSRRPGLLALDYDNPDHIALLRKAANGRVAEFRYVFVIH